MLGEETHVHPPVCARRGPLHHYCSLLHNFSLRYDDDPLNLTEEDAGSRDPGVRSVT